MTEVPGNRMSQKAEIKQTEEAYNTTVFFNTPNLLLK